MKVIFLDIDGVLNCQSSRSRCGVFIGIDSDKVVRLRDIVDATGAKIVLSSSWRDGWSKDKSLNFDDGEYIDRKLKQERLTIMDKTCQLGFVNRRKEVEAWLEGKNIESYVILDDLDFNWGYSDCINHWVQTTFKDDNGGLQDEHVKKAIEILNASNKVQATN